MKWIVRIIYLLIFIFSMMLIVTGQRSVGPMELLLMIVGLAGILILMYLYNKKYQ